MTYPHEHKTQITDMSVMLGRCSDESQHDGLIGILRILTVLISGTKTTTKTTTQIRDTKKWTNDKHTGIEKE